MNAPTTQLPPNDVGAERAVIGAVLLNPDSYGRARDAGVVVDSFYREPHRALWEVFGVLDAEQTAIDLTTVTAHLDSTGRMESIGGYSFLAGLPASTPSVSNLRHYVDIVLDRAQLRALQVQAMEVLRRVAEGGQSAKEAVSEAEQAVFALGDAQGVARGVELVGSLAEEYFDELRARADAPSTLQGLSTGFHDLDHKLGGLVPSNLIVLAGRPAMGKTAKALNIVLRAALDQAASVAIFSLEMSKAQLMGRLVSSESRVLAHRLKTGRLHADDWPLLIDALERIRRAAIWIDDRAAMSLAQVWSTCRRLRASEKGLDLAVIDYLQLMKGTGKEGNREQEISGISRGLKELAKEFNIPVIALSQLNRGVEQRADKRPLMSDLRESGAIEQDADQVVFLYRDEVYNENTEMKGIAEVLVRKNRHGDIGDVKLFWRGEYLRFENLARDEFA